MVRIEQGMLILIKACMPHERSKIYHMTTVHMPELRLFALYEIVCDDCHRERSLHFSQHVAIEVIVDRFLYFYHCERYHFCEEQPTRLMAHIGAMMIP
jgi:hypothetical protein